ncbi:competence protein ComK [Rummeliibacillus sp. NPDC094406]|uniref:competence protein ComK n=1 Tax=Rummeliibacillus sp. NPDC094406 TaxID=3364511 RepID=UPI003804ACA2
MNYRMVSLYDFCLTPNICMLKPMIIDGHNYSLVLELEKRYVVPCTVTRLMNRICASLGTTLDVTLNYSNSIFREVNVNSSKEENMIKLPIVLSVLNKPYIFFPTASPKKNHNTWILWQNFRGHSLIGKQGIGLHFKNDVYTEEQISFTTLSRQQYYASILYFRHMDNMLQQHYAESVLATVRNELFLVP